MIDSSSSEEIEFRGAGKPAPPTVCKFYHQAFRGYRNRALWNWSELDHPTITQALAVANSLRIEGDISARALAAKIEAACRAAL